MSLFKRNRIWWADFSVNGIRYRLSLGTTDWREAGCLEKEHIARACQGKLSVSGEQFARLAFVEAAKQYVESRKVELTPRSLAKERELLRGPSLYFDNTPLRRIGVEDLRAYRQERAEEGRAAVYINMEMGAIRRLLKRAKRWHLFEDNIKPLREQHREVHVLSNLCGNAKRCEFHSPGANFVRCPQTTCANL